MSAAPGQEVWLELLPGPDGLELAAVLRLHPDGEELASGSFRVEQARKVLTRCGGVLDPGACDPGAAAALGDALAHLLPNSVISALEIRLARAESTRLWVAAPRGDAVELPWELLRVTLPGGERGYLAREGVSVIRHRPEAAAPASPPGRPWTALVAWADPRSPRYGPLPQAQDEARHVLRLLRGASAGAVRVEEIPDASPAALRRRLAESPPHMLYWVGHGDLRPSGGVLVLQGERPGEHAFLYADELAAWLEGRGTRLVVLSSCDTGAPDAFVGSLARSGVPAVVGMQARVGDRAARDFARLFIGTLLRTGDVDRAVQAGRAAALADTAEWAAPVLYVSGGETHLFPPAPEDARPAARFQIPFRRPQQLVGRELDLEQLHAALISPENRPVALVGLGGIGKTQLAVEYAHRYRGFYPGGVFWVQAQDSARMVEDLASLARYWDIPENISPRRRAELVRDALQSETEPCLLVCDNAVAQTPHELLPATGPCRVLATTRDGHAHNRDGGWTPIEPGRLSAGDSAALLLGPAGPPTPEDVAAAEAIAQLLGGLPLALVLARHHVERLDITLSEYRERLAGNRVAVLEAARRRFITDTKHDGGIFDAIDLACRGLTDSARTVLATAACFAGRRISVELLDRASALGDRELFEESVAELKDTCLVVREERGRLGMHELVRVFVQGRLEDESRAALSRTAEVLLSELRSANEALDWKRVRSELTHCRTVVDLCRAAQAPQLLPLLREIGRYATHLRDTTAAAEFLSEALSLVRSRGEERTREGVSLMMDLAIAEQHRGNAPAHALALARDAVDLGRSTLAEDDALLPDLLNGLGYVQKTQGLLEPAETAYNEALQLNRRLLGADHPEVASCLNNLGALMESRGDYGQAIHLYREALRIDEERFGHEHVKIGMRLTNIGRVLALQEPSPDAVRHHERALAIYEAEYGRGHLYTATVRFRLGDAHMALSEREEAVRCYQEALPVLERYYGPDHLLCRDLRSKGKE